MSLNMASCTYARGYQSGYTDGATIAIEGLILTEETCRITANGIPLLLRPIEFRLLQFLMSQPERVHARSKLLEQLWDKHVVVGERTIDVHIRRLRMALAPFAMASRIKTHPKRGYSFSANGSGISSQA
ncbi:MAG: helix-turn-helix domain-containing protein [Gallionella sp.]|nr:helix-turn-helix domain-containing protein [Gallionella sp.]MDD4946053.1 helix-turn-helix domain-containing protein [Gallionella sp.]MDD5612240.1 helix-turn-helix domain-containing protein [Gallionella sp.]